MYRVRLLNTAAENLARLDKPVARRIVERMHWPSEHLPEDHLETLTGEFQGMFKLRVGDYRIIYELLHEEQLAVIHTIGHRREYIVNGNQEDVTI